MSTRRDKSPSYLRDSPVRDRLTTELRLRKEVNELSELVRKLERENLILRKEQVACQECSYNKAFFEKKIKTLEAQLRDRNIQTYQNSAEKRNLESTLNELEKELYYEKREKALLGQQVEDLRVHASPHSPERIKLKKLESEYTGALQKLDYESTEKKHLRVEYLRIKEQLDSQNAVLSLKNLEIERLKAEVLELNSENIALSKRVAEAKFSSPSKREQLEKLDLRIALEDAERKRELATAELSLSRRQLEENRSKLLDLSNELFEREREYKRKLHEIANFSPERSSERRLKALNDALRDSESVLESYRKELYRKDQELLELRIKVSELEKSLQQAPEPREEVQGRQDAPAHEPQPEEKVAGGRPDLEELLGDRDLEIQQLNNKLALADDDCRGLARDLEIARYQLDQALKSKENLENVLKQQEQVLQESNGKIAELSAKVYLSQVVSTANEQIKSQHRGEAEESNHGAQKELREAKDQLIQLQAEYHELSNRYTEQERLVTDYYQQIRALEARPAASSDESVVRKREEELKDALSRRETVIDEKQAEIAALNALLVESNESLQRLHQENQQLESLKNALDSQEDLIKRKDDEIAGLKTRISDLENQPPREEAANNNQELIDQHNHALAEKDAALAQKDHAISEKDQALAQKDQVIAERDHTIAENQKALEEKSKAVAGLQGEVAHLTEQLSGEKSRADQLKHQVDEQTATLASQSNRVKELEDAQAHSSAEHAQNVEKLTGAITEKDTVINKLKEDLTHAQDEKQKSAAAHEAEIAALKDAAKAHEQQPPQEGSNKELEDAHKTIATLQGTLDKQESILALKLEEISQLNQKLANIEKDHKEIIDDQNAQIDRFSEDVYEKMETISHLKEEIERKNHEIEELRARLPLGTDPENVKTEEGETEDHH